MNVPAYITESHNHGSQTYEPWGFFGGTETCQIEGLPLDHPDVNLTFSCGHCHSLALAVRSLLGLGTPLLGVDVSGYEAPDWIVEETETYWITSPNHVLATLPDGTALDINGRSKRMGDAFQPFTEVRDWHLWGYKSPRVRDALPWARLLIEAHAPEYARWEVAA